jgi:hypothetical protein
MSVDVSGSQPRACEWEKNKLRQSQCIAQCSVRVAITYVHCVHDGVPDGVPDGVLDDVHGVLDGGPDDVLCAPVLPGE